MRRRLGLWLIRLGTRLAGPPATFTTGANWTGITYFTAPPTSSTARMH
jgi:hypothetical protein